MPKPAISPYLIALVSGACALAYEVVWMRVFLPVFGLSIYSTTTVICAFMLGLGLGSWLAPHVISRWKGSFWALYALLEICIGITALAVPYCIGPITDLYVSVAAADGGGVTTAFVRFMASLLSMLLPTLFMGLTLPVLVHACSLRARDEGAGVARIGYLYGFNTVGAAIGCVLVGFVLLYQLGVSGTVAVTALLNFSVGAAVWFAYVRKEATAIPAAQPERRPQPAGPGPEPASADAGAAHVRSGAGLLVLYGVMGAVAFGYEMCWFRILVYYLQSATYSFSIMLAVFLIGLGLGSLIYSRLFDKRLRAASEGTSERVLALIQMTLALLGLLTLPIYAYVIPGAWHAFVNLVGAGSWLVMIGQKAIVACGLILLPTLLMGISFPLIAGLYRRRGAGDARAVGQLYAANTMGAIVGVLVTTFVLFELIGAQGTLALFAFTTLAIGLVFAWRSGSWTPSLRTAVGGFCVAAVVIFALTPSRLMLTNYQRFAGNILYYKERAGDITFVHERGDGTRMLAFHDGRGTSGTSDPLNYINRILAYSAMAAKPDAKNVLVISMGCGNTASAFSKFPIERLDIVDISPGPFEAARFFDTNDNVIEDPRVHTHVDDGRNFLLTTPRQYDVIQLELPTLHTDGVVTLYTKEFYEIAKARLKPGGILSQWISAVQTEREPSYMVFNTMLQVFPHSTMWTADWAWWCIGQKQDHPVAIDYAAVSALFAVDSVRADLASVSSSLEDTMSKLVSAGDLLRKTLADATVLVDDRTILDFLVPKLESPAAFGGGLGYYSSPLSHVFHKVWKSAGDGGPGTNYQMFPFYEPEAHDALVDESLRNVASSFPADAIVRISEQNGRWRW